MDLSTVQARSCLLCETVNHSSHECLAFSLLGTFTHPNYHVFIGAWRPNANNKKNNNHNTKQSVAIYVRVAYRPLVLGSTSITIPNLFLQTFEANPSTSIPIIHRLRRRRPTRQIQIASAKPRIAAAWATPTKPGTSPYVKYKFKGSVGMWRQLSLFPYVALLTRGRWASSGRWVHL